MLNDPEIEEFAVNALKTLGVRFVTEEGRAIPISDLFTLLIPEIERTLRQEPRLAILQLTQDEWSLTHFCASLDAVFAWIKASTGIDPEERLRRSCDEAGVDWRHHEVVSLTDSESCARLHSALGRWIAEPIEIIIPVATLSALMTEAAVADQPEDTQIRLMDIAIRTSTITEAKNQTEETLK
ncbi:MAG: hypothetical protein ACYDBH_06500 [Acidobacteriaceae bacterium]